jgi:glutamyl-tRNA reductase
MRVNTVSPTKTVELRQIAGGSPRSLEDCTRTQCSFHPAQPGASGPTHCPFGVIGLSYRTASVDLRGKASFTGDSFKLLLNLLREHGVSEAIVLSTCNRTEVYFAGPDHELVIRLFAAAAKVELDEIRPHLYFKTSLCAACHLFRVVSGLDSAVLGETEIVAQVKQAWRNAEEFGSSGQGLNMLLQRSMEINKRIRSETDLCRGVTSTATLAVLQAQARLGTLENRNVVLIGAGTIAERVCKDLRPLEVASLKILNRTLERAERLALRYGGEAGTLDELEEAMVRADVVISAAATTSPLIDDVLISAVTRRRQSSTSQISNLKSEIRNPTSEIDASEFRYPKSDLLLIDLGVPANIQLSTPRGDVELLNIDTLTAACSENLERRSQAVPIALDILDEELKRLREDLTTRTAAPTIKALINQAEQIRLTNLDWALERLTGLTDKERKVVEDLSNRIIKGLLQAPIQGLKHELAAAEHREIISKLFRLEEQVDEPLAS